MDINFQSEFDFSVNRQVQFERERKESENWTEEALCVQWLSGRDNSDWDWWRSLKKYERDAWISEYRAGRFKVEHGEKMPSPSTIQSARSAAWELTLSLANAWAKEIKIAFLKRKPCPIQVTPAFEVALSLAFDIANVPSECLVNTEEENEG